MTQEHPITPPPDLIEDWVEIAKPLPQRPPNPGELAALAARWGADQELEACCEWLHWQNLATHSELIPSLRAARRPKPPSLKEQALAQLDSLHADLKMHGLGISTDTIRRALEQLPE